MIVLVHVLVVLDGIWHTSYMYIVHAACNKEKGSAESWTRRLGFDRASESLELCIERR